MGVFRQLGDPVGVGVCLCQHHGAAYAEWAPSATPLSPNMFYDDFLTDSIILQQQIIITERCCINVNAATIAYVGGVQTDIEIERPQGTIRTTQESIVTNGQIVLLHHAAWEVLNAGTYTYYLMQRAGHDLSIFGAWLKIIASDCEG